MKFVVNRPFADPDGAARELIELANAVEPVQDGRIQIKKINEPFSISSSDRPVTRQERGPTLRARYRGKRQDHPVRITGCSDQFRGTPPRLRRSRA